jgi:hypothetical protein
MVPDPVHPWGMSLLAALTGHRPEMDHNPIHPPCMYEYKGPYS